MAKYLKNEHVRKQASRRECTYMVGDNIPKQQISFSCRTILTNQEIRWWRRKETDRRTSERVHWLYSPVSGSQSRVCWGRWSNSRQWPLCGASRPDPSQSTPQTRTRSTQIILIMCKTVMKLKKDKCEHIDCSFIFIVINIPYTMYI